MIIWTDIDGRVTTISYTPRDRGTVGGYDVEEIPLPEEDGELRFDVKSRQFYTHQPAELAKARETGLCPTCGQEVEVEEDSKEQELIVRRQ